MQFKDQYGKIINHLTVEHNEQVQAENIYTR